MAAPVPSTSFTVVRALIAVPPMPAPKTPMARPRRSGGNQALTNGTPTANAVPPMPRKKPPTSSAAKEPWPGQAEEQHRHDGGERHQREHDPAAEPVGQRADRDPAQRADHDRHGDQQRLLERPTGRAGP